MRIGFLLFILTIVSCGYVKTPKNGNQGPQGEPGKSASCVSSSVEGGVLVKCITGDGLMTENMIYHGIDGKIGKDGENGKDGVDGADGIDGKDGMDAVTETFACKYSASENIEMSFVGVGLSSGDWILSLHRKYKKGEFENSKYQSITQPEGYSKSVDDGVYYAEYLGDCEASLTMKKKDGAELISMECECGSVK